MHAPKRLRGPRRLLLSLPIALALAGGCASSHYDSLLPEASLPEYARLGAAADALPDELGLVAVREVDGEPVRVAWRRTRGGDGEWLVVLIHGVMTDRRTWRYVEAGLGLRHDLLLVDLVGCGQSDAPDPDDLPPEFYRPTGLARQALLAIRSCAGDERIAVVGHSLGSLAILRMLGNPELAAEFPDEIGRIERAVLLSPIDFAIACKQPAFETIAKLSGFEVAVGSALGIVRETVAEAFLEGGGPSRLPREVVDEYVEIIEDADRLGSAQAMLRMAVPFTESETLDWDEIARRVREYRNVSVPCLLISGARDTCFPCAMGYKLRAQLPRAWLRVIPRCGHSIMTDAPVEAAEWIARFVESAGEGLPPVTDGVVGSAPR